MTPDRRKAVDTLEELAGWISDLMDEAQAEAAYLPRLDHGGRMYLQGRFDTLRQTLRYVRDLLDKDKEDGHDAEPTHRTAKEPAI